MTSDPHHQDEQPPEPLGFPPGVDGESGGGDAPRADAPAEAGDLGGEVSSQAEGGEGNASRATPSGESSRSSEPEDEGGEEAARGADAETPGQRDPAEAGSAAEADHPASDARENESDAEDDARESEAGAQADESGAEEAEEAEQEEEGVKQWYIVKVQVNREDSVRRALERRIKLAGLEEDFGDIVVPTEDVAEFNKSGKRRIVKKKLYPGYIMVNLVLNDDTWFLVRETPGIGDFTGSAGKPTPMEPHEVDRIVTTSRTAESGEPSVRTSIPFKPGDRVRVKEGYFQNFEGDVDTIDDANGRVTVMINIFGRSTPVELEHWQVESV
ncbi:MAG: transcription termination/antitermination protein NusG [Planctomycetota bacterium]